MMQIFQRADNGFDEAEFVRKNLQALPVDLAGILQNEERIGNPSQRRRFVVAQAMLASVEDLTFRRQNSHGDAVDFGSFRFRPDPALLFRRERSTVEEVPVQIEFGIAALEMTAMGDGRQAFNASEHRVPAAGDQRRDGFFDLMSRNGDVQIRH